MKENNLPEEKLLKLIRGQRNFSSVNDKKPINDTDPQKFPPAIRDALQWFSFINLSFFQVRRVLFIVFLLSSIYLIGSFIYPLIGIPRFKMPALTQEKFKEQEVELNIETKPYEFYLNSIIKGGQIFKKNIASLENTQGKESLDKLTMDVTKDINLIGVVQGQNLQAIIEDKKNRKTYYVTKGQFIGEFQIEEIEQDKIIINYKGQRFELYL
jgi:hypothetical protein